MNLFFQGYQFTGGLTINPAARIRCRNCHQFHPIFGEPFDVSDFSDAFQAELEESMTAGLAEEGWKDMNCPGCVETAPDLCKEDTE